MHPYINIAISAARKAARIQLRAMDNLSKIKVQSKGTHDKVTEIDTSSEYIIIQEIQKAYPHHSILSEEAGYLKGTITDTQWIIDPLDGTTNYIYGLPHFAISIAVMIRNQLEHGIIYDPLKNELFTASKGSGAMLNDRRIRTTQKTDLKSALLSTEYPLYLDEFISLSRTLAHKISGFRRSGSAALDLAYVAAGRLDGALSYALKPWDMAAGALLIKESGGLITDMHGQADYMKTGHLITGNPKIHQGLLELIGENPRIQ